MGGEPISAGRICQGTHRGRRRKKGATSATPATLPTKAQDAAETALGQELRVAGYGATKPDGGGASPVLRDVATLAVEDDECVDAFRFFEPGEEICTQGETYKGDKHRTACYGDSGGPLIAETAADDLLVGVVSYGAVRCGRTKPTVFARVADNLGFVKKKADLN